MDTCILDTFDLSRSDLFMDNAHTEIFERLRNEDPVYLQENHPIYGSFWNVTTYKDIMFVETNHELFSSEGSVMLDDQDENFPLPMFIAMDRPEHTNYRTKFSPAFSMQNITALEELIVQRTHKVLDSLPIGEKFNWVDRVSQELTSLMLATLFDFPLEDRKKLIRWSDVATATQQHNGIVASDEERKVELMECLRVFTALREKRMAETPKNDLISLLAHSDQFKGMLPSQLLGNIALLLVAGNDTTTNTMTGGVLALNQYPEQYKKLKNDHSLIDNFVNETIRWQTPLAYMRRTAKVDVILNGKKIKAGEKLLMWYVSGNSDEEVFEDGDNFNIERKTSVLKKHLSFGFGIHRCIGKRLAELQLKILWQELLVRFDHIEVCGDPVKTRSNFIKGYSKLEVILHKS